LLQLRETVAELKRDHEKTILELTKLREEAEKAKAEAEAAKQKARMTKISLEDSIRKNDELKLKLKRREERERAGELLVPKKGIPPETEPMEVEVIPPPPLSGRNQDLSPLRKPGPRRRS